MARRHFSMRMSVDTVADGNGNVFVTDVAVWHGVSGTPLVNVRVLKSPVRKAGNLSGSPRGALQYAASRFTRHFLRAPETGSLRDPAGSRVVPTSAS